MRLWLRLRLRWRLRLHLHLHLRHQCNAHDLDDGVHGFTCVVGEWFGGGWVYGKNKTVALTRTHIDWLVVRKHCPLLLFLPLLHRYVPCKMQSLMNVVLVALSVVSVATAAAPAKSGWGKVSCVATRASFFNLPT